MIARWILPVCSVAMAALILYSYNGWREYVPVEYALQSGRAVVARAGPSAVRAGIQPGSELALAALSKQERARLSGGVTRGSTELLAVRERGGVRTVRVRADLRSAFEPGWAQLLFDYAGVIFSLTLIGILGYHRPSVMVAALLLYEGSWIYPPQLLSTVAVLPEPLFSAVGAILTAVSGAWAAAVLASFVIRFPGITASRERRFATRVVDGVVIAFFLFEIFAYFSTETSFAQVCRNAFAALLVLVSSIVALRLAKPDERARTAIVVIGAMAGGVLYSVFNALLDLAEGRSLTAILIVGDVGVILLPCCMAYAVLRHRVIDIGFVVNRTLVYTVTTAILFVVIAAVELGVERYVTGLSSIESTAVQFCLALAVICAIGAVHRRVDVFIDNVFFRKRHEAESAIRDFAREAAYMDGRATLLERASATVEANLGATFARVVFDGDDDPAFVKLRAWRSPVDLKKAGSALSGERAYPMFARGRLIAAFVVGPKRSGEEYAPDESSAIAELAQAVGAALDALDRTESEGLVLREVRSLSAKLDGVTDTLQSLAARGSANAERLGDGV